MRLKVIVCLVTILCFLSVFINDTYASSVGNVSFQGAGVVVDMEFPEEAHPTDTITLNLTITAMVALKLQNFTLVIRVLVDTGWQQVYKEQVLSLSMVQSQVLARLIWFTLPQKAHEALCCDMYIQTDKAPGLPPTYSFYATHVRTMTYGELLANYSSLLTDYEALLDSFNNLSAQCRELNSTYNLLLNQYDSLQATFDSLRNTAGTRDTELTITRNIAYALIAVIVTLVALVIYSKKKRSEPYIVLRKETVAVKPQTNIIEGFVPETYLADRHGLKGLS